MLEGIPNRAAPEACLGVCMDEAEDGTFSYLVCAEVRSDTGVPEGMVCRTIPGGTYAVFTHRGPIAGEIGRTWQYALGQWLPASDYELVDGPDFELYDERSAADPPEVDIYIPIRPSDPAGPDGG